MRCLSPYFPRSPDVPRIDDHRVISGIIAIIRHGLQWRDAPAAYGMPKMLIDHFARWSCLGVFGRVFAALAAKAEPRERLMIDSIRLETQPAADSLPKKDFSPLDRPNKERPELQAPRRLRWPRPPAPNAVE